MQPARARVFREVRRSSVTPRLGFCVAEAARATSAGSFAPGSSPRSICETVYDLAQLADQLTEHRKEVEPPSSAIECRNGCSHCCSMRVYVTPPEVILLAEHVRANFPDERIRGLVQRLGEAHQTIRSMTDEEHGRAGVQCPLLVDGSCSAYEARPFECRGYVSMDVESCRRAARNYDSWNVPIYTSQYSIFKHVQMGLLAALLDAEYEFEILELTAALRVALEVPDAADRWLAGEHVFEAAALPASDPEVAAAYPWTPTFEAPRWRSPGKPLARVAPAPAPDLKDEHCR
jgi:hypothetical protein